MLKERLISDIKTNGHNHNLEKSDLIVRITEWKAASLALGFSLLVLISKTLLSNRKYIFRMLSKIFIPTFHFFTCICLKKIHICITSLGMGTLLRH